MEIQKKQPTTNGVRHQINLVKSLLTKRSRLVKTLFKGFKKQSGRSSVTGQITVRHKGGGVKRLFRIINFDNYNYTAIVIASLYDPNRNSFISLNYDLLRNSFFNTLMTDCVLPGALIKCANKKHEYYLGNRFRLEDIPAGSVIHSVALVKHKSATYIRAAGTFGQIIQKTLTFCRIKLPSKRVLHVSINAFATIGTISNKVNNLVYIGKAGRSRLKGVRPSVRGIAMNPVDHPHGGKSNAGKPCVTPWGKPTKGQPTVKKKKNL